MIHRIPIPTPFPVGPVNVYLIEGERPVLIDAGLRSEESFSLLDSGLAARGLAVADLRLIVLTHHHVDHAGGARRLQELSGARVLAHPVDRAWLRGSFRHPAVSEALAEAGLAREGLESLAAVYSQILGYQEPLPEVEPLGEGDIVPTGAGTLTVLHTPGHTPGSLCLLREDGTLFSGDTILERITPNAILDGEGPGRFRALPAYIRTLGRLARLRPRPILPGHGEPFDDLELVLDQALVRYRERGEKILEHLGEGPLTVAELGERLFGSTEPGGIFLVISEVFGNLDLLEEHGAVEVAARQPLRYRASARLPDDYPRRLFTA